MKKFIILIAIIVSAYGVYSLFGSKDASSKNVSTETQSDYSSATGDNKQIVKATITQSAGLSPSTFTLKKGVPARLEIDPKDNIGGCMSTIMIPEFYRRPSFIRAGQKIVMEFTPTTTGTYDITCAMGVPWGEIKVTE